MRHIRYQEQELPEVPECVHTAILTTLENLEADRNMMKKTEYMEKQKHSRKTRFSGKKVAVLAAAMTAVLGMTVLVAAAESWWDQRAVEEFGNPAPEMQEQMAEAGVARIQTVSATDAGITVTAVQTLRDANRIYMLFELTAEEAVIDGNSGFSGWKMITDEGRDLTDYERGLSGGGGMTDDVATGTLSDQGLYFWDIVMDGSGAGWNGDTLTVRFTDFDYYTYENGPEGTAHKITGSWELVLPLTDTSELARTFTPEKTVTAAGMPVRLNSVTVTPLTVTLHYDLEDVEAAGATSAEDYTLSELFAAGVVDRDGNRQEGIGGITGSRTKDEEIITCGLSSPVDVDTVQAVLLGGGETVELE